MPPPSATAHLPSAHPAQRQRPKSPNRILAEAEAQWLFTPAELLNTPTIQDGMSVGEERDIRAKGVNFIVQVGIMLKLPQLTLSTAAIFFQRFLMRASLKKPRGDIPKLHHYQIAATALFLATKVEESCRKMKEMILAFCRVAQKNPNLVIDEQSKDFWRWRDCILHNEDVLLETLCFDLTVESPHRQLFEMLKYQGVEHNKRLRNAAWAFVTDGNNTQLCLLCSSRTIAVAGLWAASRYCGVPLENDAKGRPWWEAQGVRVKDVRQAIEYMVSSYEAAANKVNGVPAASGGGGTDGEKSIYVGLTTPAHHSGMEAADGWEDTTRVKDELSPVPPPSQHPNGNVERRISNASSIGEKRKREDQQPAMVNGNGEAAAAGNSNGVKVEATEGKRIKVNGAADAGMAPADRDDARVDHDVKEDEERLRVENGNKESAADLTAAEATTNGGIKDENVASSSARGGEDEGDVEEGEVEE